MAGRNNTWRAPVDGDLPLVLVAEDDTDLRALFVDALVHAGHRVVGLPDGGALSNMLEILASQRVVVLTDHRMPYAWGLDCIAQYRGNARFILVTGYADDALRTMATHCGVSEVFQKPVDLDVLIHAIDRATQSW